LAENHPNRVVAYYQITGMVGKAYLKSATATIVVNGFRKTGLFPCKCQIQYLINMILEESQLNITRRLLDNLVPCTGIADETPTINQQSLRQPHKTPPLFFCPLTLALFQIPLVGNKSSQKT
jgi:hypothetical protein